MPLILAAALLVGSWTIDPQRSTVGFTVMKFGREVVHGRFRHFSGAVAFDPRFPERSSMHWRVRIASVRTGEPVRDEALQGPAFFDAARVPEMSFVSDRIRRLPDGRMHVSGRLTIRGVTRPLVITARPLNSDQSYPMFETRFELNRHDFGVSGGSVSRHGISDMVKVHLRFAGAPR
jgi:polyisoprenoid-binding protein YceI